MSRQIHPRNQVVSLARLDLSDAVIKLCEKHDLSFPELLFVLSQELQTWAGIQVREERKEGEGTEP